MACHVLLSSDKRNNSNTQSCNLDGTKCTWFPRSPKLEGSCYMGIVGWLHPNTQLRDRWQVCASLQTDNHANTPPLSFLQAGCPSCCPTNSVRALKCHKVTHTHTHTHPFKGPFSGTTQVSRYQKGKTNLDFTGARDSEWQWRQLGHMQVCTLLQTDNHASTPPLSFYRPDALPAAQPTVSKH